MSNEVSESKPVSSRFFSLSCTVLYLFVTSIVIAGEFSVPLGTDIIGEQKLLQARYEDTFSELARRHDLGYEEMVRANPGVDPWLPGEGTTVSLPLSFILPQAQRIGLVINIAEYRMYYFTSVNDQLVVSTFPISIGKMDWSTPLGKSSVVAKMTQPAWYPPESIREEYAADGRHLANVVPPGPDNPLGEYAMRLSIPGYLIHGTNRPTGVGMQVTHGCIRMYPEDIEWLFPQVAVDTTVRIVNQPYKFGWQGNELFLEVHPALGQKGSAQEQGMTDLMKQYVKATAEQNAEVNWQRVTEVFAKKLGIPVSVGTAVSMNSASGPDKLVRE